MSSVKVKIKDIGKVVTGKTPKTNINEYWNSNDVPFVKPTDFINAITILDKYKTYLSFEGYEKSNRVPKNSVLVTCIGTIGKVAINNIDVATNQQINSIIPNERVNYKYLMFQMLEKNEYLNHISNAPVIPIINKTTFENIEINLPTLTKQKEIASVLDKAQELISLRKESIIKLEELSKSVFIDMFGDPVSNPKKLKSIKISEFATVKTGKTPSRDNPTFWNEGTELWATTTEVNSRFIHNTNEKITVYAVEKNNLQKFESETILMAMYGQGKTRGKVALLKNQSTINQAFCAILKNDTYNTVFLFSLLENMYSHIRSLSRGGNQKNLNLNIVKDINIIFPDLKEQNKFAKIIEKIEEQKSLYEEELNKLEENFKALLQKSFN